MSQTVFDTPPKAGISSITPAVVEQIKIRKELVSKKYSDPDFTQTFLTSNYAWVRMVSGVNIEGEDNAAKKHQLLGGSLYDGKRRAGFNFSESFLDDTTGAVYTQQKEGIKPMPGITDFSIENAGEEGLLRQVNVQVQCHSLEQFSIFEKLYMRPGYLNFIEWGHSCYIDRSGNKVFQPKIMDDSTLFPTEMDPDKINEKGAELIYDSQHNYDFILAKILNYEWSYDNGIYTLDIVMRGTGGLSATQERMFNLGTDKETPPEDEPSKDLEFDSASKLAGTFGSIMRAIYESAERGRDSEEELKPIQVDQGRLDDAIDKRKVREEVDAIVEEIGDGFKLEAYRLDFLKSREKFVYIPMKFIFGCINYLHLPRVAGQDHPDAKFCTKKERSLYLTFKDHYSTDPFVCLLPKQEGNVPIKTDALKGARDNSEMKGDFMDIWVNSKYVYDTMMKLIKNKKSDYELSVGHFLKELLFGVEEALGSINDFKLFSDYYLKKEEGPSYVVDKVLPHKPEGSEESQNININPFGTESLVKGFSFNTNIDEATLYSVTTQAVLDGSDAAKASSKGAAAYNFGISNRFKPGGAKGAPDGKEGDSGAQAAAVAEKYATLFDTKIYNQDTIKSIKQSAASALQIAVNDELAAKGKHTGFVIPGTLNITMLGLGGLKRLEYFRMPYDMLPEAYKSNEVIFMIDKVSHDFDGGVWNTTIDANVLKI